MQRNFRTFAGLIIIMGLCLIGVIYREDVFMFYSKYYDSSRKNITISNFSYAISNKYSSLSLTNDFIAKDKEQLLDIYYTIVNSGNNRFTFFCDVDYEECLKDIETISKNEEALSIINNYVHPFNTFSTVKTLYSSSGKVEIEIIKNYTSEQIIYLNQIVDDFINKNINDSMSQRDKIKIVHDYITDNTKYDQTHDLKAQNNIYKSNTAYGVFANRLGICSGYTDAMALFLYEFKIDNFKISNDNHIWNYVVLDNNGYHLDVTWDDPVLESGENKTEYYFFLIDDQQLKELSEENHNYNKELYQI